MEEEAKARALRTMQDWLRRTFVEKEGATVPRADVYAAYVAECKRQGFAAANQSTFGKFFRSTFPTVSSRRLGGRVHNKMHHLNVTWRDTLDTGELHQLDSTRRERKRQNQELKWITYDVHEELEREEEREGPVRRRTSAGRNVHPEEEEQVVELPRDERRSHKARTRNERSQARMQGGGAALYSWGTDVHMIIMSMLKRYCTFYKRETLRVHPINPLSLKIQSISHLLTTEEGREEVSALALCAYGFISMSSYMFGDINVSQEYYYKALYQVRLLMNESDYDIASIMPPLAWWSQMFADNPVDAKHNMMYILAIGKNICERVGAINDSTYVGILRLMAMKNMRDPSSVIAATKRYPEFRPSWRKRTQEHHPVEVVLFRMGDLWGAVLRCYGMLKSGMPLTEEQRHEITVTLHAQVHEAQEVEQLVNKIQTSIPRPAPQISSLILCSTLGLKAMAYMLLDSPKQAEAARAMLLNLLTVEHKFLNLILLEMTSNDGIILKECLSILARWRELRLLSNFLDALRRSKELHYFMKTAYELAQEQYQSATSSTYGYLITPISGAPPITAESLNVEEVTALQSTDPEPVQGLEEELAPDLTFFKPHLRDQTLSHIELNQPSSSSTIPNSPRFQLEGHYNPSDYPQEHRNTVSVQHGAWHDVSGSVLRYQDAAIPHEGTPDSALSSLISATAGPRSGWPIPRQEVVSPSSQASVPSFFEDPTTYM